MIYLKQVLPFLLVGFPVLVHSQPLPNFQETLSVQSKSFQVVVPPQDFLAGGYLQGIQLYNDNLFVTGSSKQFAYLAIFKKDENDFHFLGIKKLGGAPLNHAGGFQMTENWLAVGIEDPKQKKHSVIQLIDVSSAQTISAPPVYILERKGEAKRSTAGAVALLKRDNHFLLAVGSWDCSTIDFYTSNHSDPITKHFDFTLWTSWDSRQAIRKNWTDNNFCSYQNLQLTEDSTGVYITGFCRAKNGVDKADVFKILTNSNPYELLQKTASYSVQCKGEVTFRNGSGFTEFDDKKSIIAVGRNLSPKMQVQVFPIKVD